MLVFVYGTLKRGYGNNRLLQEIGAVFLGMTTTATPTFDLVTLGPFPGLSEGKYLVSGELYRIEDAGLAMLDRLEGHPTFYCRHSIQVFEKVAGRQVVVEAKAYFINGPERYENVDLFEDNAKTVKVWV